MECAHRSCAPVVPGNDRILIENTVAGIARLDDKRREGVARRKRQGNRDCESGSLYKHSPCAACQCRAVVHRLVVPEGETVVVQPARWNVFLIRRLKLAGVLRRCRHRWRRVARCGSRSRRRGEWISSRNFEQVTIDSELCGDLYPVQEYIAALIESITRFVDINNSHLASRLLQPIDDHSTRLGSVQRGGQRVVCKQALIKVLVVSLDRSRER